MRTKAFLIFIFFILLITGGYISSSEQPQKIQKEKLINTAKKIIGSSDLCVLITTGENGFPNTRVMDPFPPDKNMVVRMGTNSNSRKVKEIKKNNKVTIYYEIPGGDGYVNLKGEAYLIDKEEEKRKYWKKGWEKFYPPDRNNFILIKVVPVKLEIVSYKNGLTGDPVTWEAPSLSFYKSM
ncbi:MAG: pyridoxamine 5'-phosphate oxidase family protein [Acidobacteriota bacterium]